MMVSLSRAPLGTVSITDHRRFTQSISYISSNTDLIGFEQIILFGHPELIHLAKKARHFYIDGTWATPPGFMQILIVMIYEEATDIYIFLSFFACLKKKGQYLQCCVIAYRCSDRRSNKPKNNYN